MHAEWIALSVLLVIVLGLYARALAQGLRTALRSEPDEHATHYPWR